MSGFDPNADLIRSFGARVFRRPLASAEVGAFQTLFAEALAAYGYRDAVRMSVHAFLLAPEFLYKHG